MRGGQKPATEIDTQGPFRGLVCFGAVLTVSSVSRIGESVLSRRSINQRTIKVSEPTVAQAIENIYASLRADNADIDAHIATLKAALAREGIKQAVFDPTKLVQNNRQGRKLMQAYFRQRGVSVTFSGE